MRARSIAFFPFAMLLACGSDPAAGAAPLGATAAGAPLAPVVEPGPAAAAESGLAIAIERFDASVACDGVVPEDAPAPVDAAAAVADGATCLPPRSDGTGAVALACAGPEGGTTVWTFDSSGRVQGNASVGALSTLEPRPRGFHAIAVLDGAARFLAIGADGTLERSEPVAPPELTLVDARLGPDPAGGGVVVARGTHVAGNHWFELLASRRDGDGSALGDAARITNGSDPTSPTSFAGAASTAGGTLAVWGERGTAHAAWLDRDGTPLGAASDEGSADALGLGIGAAPELAPLLDGSVALRAGAEWRRAWAPTGPGDAPPDWLASRPATRVRLVRGASAHALVPDPAPSCAQRIELRNAAGLLCGAVTVSADASPCPTVPLEVGRDGTLLAAPSTGTVRFWPALLR